MDYETGFKAIRSGGYLKIGVVAEQTLYKIIFRQKKIWYYHKREEMLLDMTVCNQICSLLCFIRRKEKNYGKNQIA